MNNQVVVNKRQGQKLQCSCRECKRITKHVIVTEATESGSSGTQQYEFSWASEYQIVRCLGCESFMFRRAESNSEDSHIQIGPDEWEENIREELFPNPLEGRQPIADSVLLPEKIQRIYQESLAVLNRQQEVLCGIGLRAIVETVCKDKSAIGDDLFAKVNSLVALGVLTKDGADILHKVRTLGNKAAHEVKPHTPKELGLAFDVVDHLLLGVYILPQHAKITFK
jgi:hypothetical protein